MEHVINDYKRLKHRIACEITCIVAIQKHLDGDCNKDMRIYQEARLDQCIRFKEWIEDIEQHYEEEQA